VSRCGGTTRGGRQCTVIVKPPNTYCYAHDPARSEERKRNASKGGRSKPNRELQTIKGRLSELAEDVLAGTVDRANAAVAGQLYNTIIRAVGVELKVREQQELTERIEELESTRERQKFSAGKAGTRM
jgi:glutathione S-transferase